MPIVDSAIYDDGVRRADTPTLDLMYDAARDAHAIAWIGLYRPTDSELQSVATEFDLHHLAIEDAKAGHQRAKLERYGDTIFVVLRPARYLDEPEKVEFGEVHCFVNRDFVVTIRQAESPDLTRVRRRLEAEPALLELGTGAVLYGILDQVVDEYLPVIMGLQNDIDEIEEQLFGGDPSVSRRIYELVEEVMALQRAVTPLQDMIETIRAALEPHEEELELRRGFRDVLDHVVSIVAKLEALRTLLQNALTVHSTLTTQRQNEEMQRLTEASLTQGRNVQKVSGWAAILFAPSLVGAVYGMNFTHMPELDWRFGYPFALGLMVTMAVGLFAVFKWRRWF